MVRRLCPRHGSDCWPRCAFTPMAARSSTTDYRGLRQFARIAARSRGQLQCASVVPKLFLEEPRISARYTTELCEGFTREKVGRCAPDEKDESPGLLRSIAGAACSIAHSRYSGLRNRGTPRRASESRHALIFTSVRNGRRLLKWPITVLAPAAR